MAESRDYEPIHVKRRDQRDRTWPSKKAKPFGLRLTYKFTWARMEWVSTNWYPTVTARDAALRDLHKPGRLKSMPVKIEQVER